jgi:UDP-2,3-diacylglucosamine hydrolase
VEQTLGLICGAGPLPARMALEARRRGWRVIAFAFADADGLADAADRTLPARFHELAPVLDALQRERASAVLFSGRFSMGEIVRTDAARADAFTRAVGTRAGSRIDAALVTAIITTLTGFGIEVLDQRPFFGDAQAPAGVWSARGPSDAEQADIVRGLAAARMIADARIGQTVVVRHGVVTAMEAVEGTTEAIRRGTAQAGPGAVIVKAVAADHDYRFDVPAIGLETLDAAAGGGAVAIAVEASRVVVLDRDAVVRAADAAGIALVGVS